VLHTQQGNVTSLLKHWDCLKLSQNFNLGFECLLSSFPWVVYKILPALVLHLIFWPKQHLSIWALG
jgi:hypothetical protein